MKKRMERRRRRLRQRRIKASVGALSAGHAPFLDLGTCQSEDFYVSTFNIGNVYDSTTHRNCKKYYKNSCSICFESYEVIKAGMIAQVEEPFNESSRNSRKLARLVKQCLCDTRTLGHPNTLLLLPKVFEKNRTSRFPIVHKNLTFLRPPLGEFCEKT